MQKPLVSVIIISYKNYLYIYEALNSVLSQTYPNIELIISNDGSSDFDKPAIEKYLKKHAKKNIKRIVVNNNKTNLGTVKNANIALKLSKGEYILLFAADDAMYSQNVITKFVKSFETLPEKELIVTSQVGMYDLSLKKIKEYFVSPKNKELITKLNPKELFGELSTKCIIPGVGTCYKRKIFEKYGYFDEKYKLVEDYSSSLKYSRLGIKHNFFDFISFKHRDGGISHGNTNGDSTSNQKYDLDILNILKYETLPHINSLNKKQKKEFINLYKKYQWNYLYKYTYKNGSKNERRKFVVKNFRIMLDNFLKKIFREILNQAKNKKTKIFILGLFLLTAYSANIDFGSGILSILNTNNTSNLATLINKIIGFSGFFIIFFTIFYTIYKFLKKYLIQILNFIKFII